MSVASITGLLLVDAGNTRLKWLLLQDDGGQTSLNTADQQADAYTSQESPQTGSIRILRQLLAQYRPKRMVMVHVLGGELTQALHAICQQNQCDLLLVNAGRATYGIKSAYVNPAHLGADRLVGLVAARFFAPKQAAIIVDCGTAVTVDALNSNGQHLGGLILPGLGLLSDSLIRRTQAKHMDASIFEQPEIFADNTAQGIGSGCLFSLVGAIEGICQRMQNKMIESPMKIICGGDASRVHPHLIGGYRLESAALMTGLWVIAEHN